VGVADAFFFEKEFQDTGSFVYRLYKASYGARPTYAQFMPDRARVVGGSNLDQSKTDFVVLFVQRSDFTAKYPTSLSGPEFVDAVIKTVKDNTGVDLSGRRSEYIAAYNSGSSQAQSRGLALRKIAESQELADAVYNESFVVMEYFGYLRRDPEEEGYKFWKSKVDPRPLRDVAIQQAMACSFITSREYQERFSSVVTHTNQECPQQ
jgi:hypothetical protein